MNAAGYRYAASDQAFYIPAILRHLDPGLFPRDAAMIDSQAKLALIDEIAAAVVSGSGVSLQHLFFGLYLVCRLLLEKKNKYLLRFSSPTRSRLAVRLGR